MPRSKSTASSPGRTPTMPGYHASLSCQSSIVSWPSPDDARLSCQSSIVSYDARLQRARAFLRSFNDAVGRFGIGGGYINIDNPLESELHSPSADLVLERVRGMPTAHAEGETESEGGIGKISVQHVFRCLQIGPGPRRSPSACAEILKTKASTVSSSRGRMWTGSVPYTGLTTIASKRSRQGLTQPTSKPPYDYSFLYLIYYFYT